ncbi:unnamed protein product [Prorocentrum cordatum]|uniref:H(+)-exporting diphosphatase n=1 Tax=Prorocentrum cordatum TaxID=2364126 RepID=A0ABN9XRH5_9DINO|nr:unnamed protein product [Polarella glacialis]
MRPEEQAQVVFYRSMLVITAFSWFGCYTLDFFMTSGIDIIDPGMQKSALEVADLCAGMAALAAPTGSLLLLGAVLKALGVAAVAAVALGATGAAKLGSLAGPACCILICARETDLLVRPHLQDGRRRGPGTVRLRHLPPG